MNDKTSSGVWWTLGATALIIVIAIWASRASAPIPVNTAVTSGDLPGMQSTLAPWPEEIDHLKDRLSAIGLPALSAEGTVLHIHQHIDIFVNGKSVTVPAGIGINESAGFISPIHTHDETGVIHVESPTVQTFTLGQFFDIWGLKFTGDCIGSYCENATSSLAVYVNGTLYTGNPRALVLAAHQEIAVVYGTAEENPKPIPSTYAFPAGE